MTQAPPPIFARLWRWGVLPIVIGGVLLVVVEKIVPWFPGSPYGLMMGTVLGFYLGFLARTLRALLIGLNGGALCGLVLQGIDDILREPFEAYQHYVVWGTEVVFTEYTIAWLSIWPAFYISMGFLSGFFRGGRVFLVHGCVRGLLAGLVCWIGVRTLLTPDPFVDLLPFQMIQSLALIPLLLFSPLLKPPVDESSQPAPAAHQEEEDHGS